MQNVYLEIRLTFNLKWRNTDIAALSLAVASSRKSWLYSNSNPYKGNVNDNVWSNENANAIVDLNSNPIMTTFYLPTQNTNGAKWRWLTVP